MKVKEAITLFQYYRHSSHKKRTTASYLHLLKKFESLYGERPFDSMEADKIYLLGTLTEGLAKSSRRLRYAQLKAFYNFIITRCSLNELPYEKRREAERALNHAFGSKDFRDLFDRDREIKAD